MATLAVTVPANANAGSVLRRMAWQLQIAAAGMPDNASTGASTVLTIDNAPAAGICTVQVTAGPYPSALLPV